MERIGEAMNHFNRGSGERLRYSGEKLRNFRGVFFCSVVVPVLLVPVDCYAYIDPNVGGWLFQLLFPILVAIGGAYSIFRHRIGALWHRIFRRTEKRE